MGFFDKLFGRGKDVAEDVGQKTEEYGEKAMDTAGDAAKDVGEKAEEGYDAAKDKVTGGDEGQTREPPPPPQQP
jgi:hypothetical protein